MKITKAIIISSLLLLILPINLQVRAENVENPKDNAEEQTEPNQEQLKNFKGLGITFGYLSSIGLSYRQYFADKFGVKLTGIGYFDQNQTFGTLGLQGMYVLGENDWMRFYSLAGVSTFATKSSYNSYPTSRPNGSDYVNIPAKNSSNVQLYNSIGAGVGIEFGRQSQNLSFALELPFIVSFKGTTLSSFYPIPSVSLIYNF
ncbi:MAG: hypothetical protein H7263_08485 [Candidatus Sericytochromatia bacterium]|nr:hypothetical protein [Candidatus Sericytochromatia bacterium]